jgi:uncharacterized membrane-anchored protein
MRFMFAVAIAVVLGVSTPSLAQPTAAPSNQGSQLEALPWINAPQSPQVTNRATIKLGPDVQFLDANATRSFMTLTGNLPDGENYVLVSKNRTWWAAYNFADIGYVKDDEKIDAAALLQQMKDGDAAQNEARAEMGLEPLTTVGWAVPPHYDPTTNNLEYGITLSAPSGQNINYHMRILGRRGVMDATLVTSAETLQTDLAAFRQANKGFAFVPDERYAAYKDGDKVSEYGLAALITGGAAAAAAKKGLFAGLLLLLAKFWKLIALAVAGGLFAFRRFFTGNRDNDLLDTPSYGDLEALDRSDER